MHDAIRHLDTLFDARDVSGDAAGDEREVLFEVAGGDVGSEESVRCTIMEAFYSLWSLFFHSLEFEQMSEHYEKFYDFPDFR